MNYSVKSWILDQTQNWGERGILSVIKLSGGYWQEWYLDNKENNGEVGYKWENFHDRDEFYTSETEWWRKW